MRFDLVTLFPEIFTGYLGQGLLKRAIDRGLVDVRLHNLRDWATDKHRSVDDRPFGGGPGMVIRVDVAVACVEAVRRLDPEPGRLVMLTPQGRRLRQAVVEELAVERRMILLCGRYEGFDERIRQVLQPDEVSLGDFVLNGGEVAAMAVIDAAIRLVPGVLGDEESNQTDSFSGAERLLEFAQYTRPREFRGLEVPPILLGGDHQAIARWREQNRTLRTRQRRADLLENQIPKERENHEPRIAEAGREEQLEG
jgi:tRNA (guanine37-N1)-methyltransferase